MGLDPEVCVKVRCGDPVHIAGDEKDILGRERRLKVVPVLSGRKKKAGYEDFGGKGEERFTFQRWST